MPDGTDTPTRPRVFSGIQPTAESFQLGNYLGAVRHWVDLQATHDAFYCVVDLHALIAEQNAAALRSYTRASFAQLLAAGLDLNQCTVFVQSDVAEHAQLAWVLNCVTAYGEAARMTQFKDKSARAESAGSSISLGLFTYPVLQAADILLYQAQQVPVGEDQRQHLELSRDLARRFNSRYGTTFVEPQAHIIKATGKILDLQDPTAKMSKSVPAGNVALMDLPKTLEKRIKSAVTDSLGRIADDPVNQPGVTNLLTILAAFTGTPVPALVGSYDGQLYGALKKDVAEAVLAFVVPFQERTRALLGDPAELDRLMARGAERAREVAGETLAAVHSRIGFR